MRFKVVARSCLIDEPPSSPCYVGTLPNGFHMTVRLRVSDAAGPSDFLLDYLELTPREASIPQRASSVIFTLPTTNNNVDEPDGEVTVKVLPPDGLESVSGRLDYQPHPLRHTAGKTITDDDAPSTGVVLTAFPNRVAEGEFATLVMRVALNGSARTQRTTLQLQGASGTAIQGQDFGTNRLSVDIRPRDTFVTANFGVLAAEDSIFEGDERFLVTGSEQLGANAPPEQVPLPVTPARVTITDDDVASTAVELTMAPQTISEEIALSQVRVTATLDQGARTDPIEVTVNVTGDTADPDDFAPISDFTFTIPAERLSATVWFTIRPVNDSVAGGDKTLKVSGVSALPVIPASVTILDDETASTAIALAISPESVPENETRTRLLRVTATLNEDPRPDPTEVMVRVDGGTAEADDFVPVPDFRLTIPAGASSHSTRFPFGTKDDGIAEGDETVAIRGVESPLPVTPTVLTIGDDEVASDRFTLAANPTGVTESAGATPVTVTATVNRDPRPDDLEVTLFVGASTALPPEDFTALGVSEAYVVAGGRRLPVALIPLTIPAGSTSGEATFTLTPVDDATAELTEVVQILGSAAGFPAEVIPLALNDNDTASTAIAVTAEPRNVREGELAVLRVTATLSDDARPVGTVVTVTPEAGTAGDDDFQSFGSTEITIPAHEVSGSELLVLKATEDTLGEGNETLELTGTSALPVTAETVTIVDNEEVSTSVLLSTNPQRVLESAGPTAVEVFATLDKAPLPTDTSVAVSVGDGSTEPADREILYGDFTISIPAKEQRGAGSFLLVPTQDSIAEGNETLTLTGSSASDLAVEPGEFTIVDDDSAPTGVILSLDSSEVAEDAGVRSITVTTALNGPALPVSTMVTVTASGGTATSGTDYSALSAFTVTIPANQVSKTATLSFSPSNDNVAEGDETVVLSGQAADLQGDSVTLTIADDDVAPTEIALTLSPESVPENSAGTDVRVTATLSGATLPAATPVTLSVEDGSAVSDADYGTVASFTVTIPARNASATGTFSFDPADDALAEGDESVQVSGTAEGFTVSPATLTIADDEPSPTLALTLNRATVSESADATRIEVTAMLAGSTLPAETNVTVRLDGGSATSGRDYAPVTSFILTIPAGATSATGDFDLDPLDDLIAEGRETVVVKGLARGLGESTSELTITDNDSVSTGVTLAVNPARVDERVSSSRVRVTATLNAGARTEDTVVTVSVSGGTAVAGQDFGVVPSFALTIPATRTSGEQSFDLSPVNDGTAEGDETVAVTGRTTVSEITAVTAATLTLADDDTPSTRLELTLDVLSVAENGGEQAVNVTATLDAGARADETAVTVSVESGTAIAGTDFALVGDFVLTIPAQTDEGTGMFRIVPTNDLIAEGAETLTVSGRATALTITPATLRLADDEAASTGIELTLDVPGLAENGGEHAVTVTASVNAGARTEATPVTIEVGAPGDEATAGTDYEAVTDFTVTIAEGSTSGTGTFTLTPADDELGEGDEGITIGGTSALPVAGASLVLTDDDAVSTGVTLSVAPESVAEDAGATAVVVTATLDGSASATATEVTVSVGAVGDGAAAGTDYQAVSNFSLTVPAGMTSGTETFTLTPRDDGLAEGDEEITVEGSATGLAVTGTELVLTDDDTASTGVTLSVAPQSVGEDAGATASVTATLDGSASPTATEVTVSVGAVGDGAAAGTDYQAVSNFSLTVPAGMTSGTGTFTLTPDQDQVAEGDEGITIAGTSVLPVTGTELTLTDDDTASTGVTLSVAPESVGRTTWQRRYR